MARLVSMICQESFQNKANRGVTNMSQLNYNWDVARENMKRLRKKAGLSLVEFGRSIGYGERTIWSIEAGRSGAKMMYVIDFCNYFKISLEDLFDANLL